MKETIDNIRQDDDDCNAKESKVKEHDGDDREGIKHNNPQSRFRVILVERKATSFGTKYYKRSNKLNSGYIPYQSDCYGYHDSSLAGKHFYPKQKGSHILDLRKREIVVDKKNRTRIDEDITLQKKNKNKRNIHWGRPHIQRPVAPVAQEISPSTSDHRPG